MSNYNIEVGKRIKKQRLGQQMTLRELGDKVSLSEGNVQRYEVGKIKSVDINMVKSFAKALNTTPSYLMGWDKENIVQSEKVIEKGKSTDIAMYSNISCGSASFVSEDIEEYISVPQSMLPNSDSVYFSNKAKGDSMIDVGIYEGNLLIFEHTNFLQNFEIGAFCINGEYTCKKYTLKDNKIILKSMNDDFEDIYVEPCDDFRIIGRLKLNIGSF